MGAELTPTSAGNLRPDLHFRWVASVPSDSSRTVGSGSPIDPQAIGRGDQGRRDPLGVDEPEERLGRRPGRICPVSVPSATQTVPGGTMIVGAIVVAVCFWSTVAISMSAPSG